MSKLKVLIADDEPLARERVRALLRSEPEIEIVAECGNGPDAIAAMRTHKPDVAFLDMQMPGADGLQVAGALPPAERPAIVFVTAHDRFALDAFGVRATDYLLKPFDQERFQQALKRAVDDVKARRAGDLNARLETLLAEAVPAKKPERLAFKADGRVVFVRPADIVWVEAADNYVLLHLLDAPRLMLRDTLSALEERLGSTDFARVNRSALVRLEQIKELQPTLHGDYAVVLRDGTRIPLSRSYRGQLSKFAAGGF